MLNTKASAVSWEKDDLKKIKGVKKKLTIHHTMTTLPNHIPFVSYFARVLELIGCHVEEIHTTKFTEN